MMPEGRFHRLFQRIFRRGGALLTLLLVGVLPAAGGCSNVNFLSTSEEIRIGEQSEPQFIKQSGGLIQDEQLQSYVDTVGRKILDQVKPDKQREVPWEFHAVRSPQINAFALPGGKVFVTHGLLSELNTEAQMAGVLGHEVGHVIAEHIGEQMTQQMILETGLAAVGAATRQDWIQTVGGIGGGLYMLRFSRGNELESDQLGLTYMTRAGYDPRALVEVVEILKEAGGRAPIEFLSTHPNPDSRLEQLKKLIEERYGAELRQGATRFETNPEAYQQNVLQRLGPPAEPSGSSGGGG